MTEEIKIARCGLPYAQLDGKALQSAYDPQKEAERFIAEIDIKPSARIFILFAPCLDYLSRSIARRRQDATFILIQCSAFFKNRSFSNWPCWTPVSTELNYSETSTMVSKSLQIFLDELIPDSLIDTIQLIVWQPATLAYGQIAIAWLSLVSDIIKRKSHGQVAVRFFGTRWFRNAINALTYSRRTTALVKGKSPVLIIGAGPSLIDHIDSIRQAVNNGIFILAVSSALEPLYERGIHPHLVLATDGGYWAKLHMRKLSDANHIISAPLTAMRPSQNYDCDWFALSDLSTWQNLLARSLRFPVSSIPQRGTVAATAFDLALAISDGPIYFCGFDFKQSDIIAHAQPNALDNYLSIQANRLSVHYSIEFDRSLALSDAETMAIYASWLKERLYTIDRPVFGLEENDWFPPNVAIHTHVKPNYLVKPSLMPIKATDVPFLAIKAIDRRKITISTLRSFLIEESNRHFSNNFQIHDELLELLEPSVHIEWKTVLASGDSGALLDFILKTDEFLHDHLESFITRNANG